MGILPFRWHRSASPDRDYFVVVGVLKERSQLVTARSPAVSQNETFRAANRSNAKSHSLHNDRVVAANGRNGLDGRDGQHGQKATASQDDRGMVWLKRGLEICLGAFALMLRFSGRAPSPALSP